VLKLKYLRESVASVQLFSTVTKFMTLPLGNTALYYWLGKDPITYDTHTHTHLRACEQTHTHTHTTECNSVQ